ncbi:MAG: type polyketide synthase [Frankiales bacterium]|nr:type polyketide synthase [Frankiales bacterium]
MSATSSDAARALRLLAAELRSTPTTREHFSSPSVVEAAASLIAEALRDARPEVVVTWESLNDAVLAHEVARQLGIRTAVVLEPQEGVLDLSPALRAGARVALLATSFNRTTPHGAAASLIEQRGGVLVKVASLAPAAERGDGGPQGREYVFFAD